MASDQMTVNENSNYFVATKTFDICRVYADNGPMQTLKQMVTVLRSRGYSQARIGRIAGVSQMTVSRWEKEEPKRTDMTAHRRLLVEVKA